MRRYLSDRRSGVRRRSGLTEICLQDINERSSTCLDGSARSLRAGANLPSKFR